jgi:hypothetical protein
MVWPSGADFAVSAAAIMPEAPALLSTTTDLPSCLENCSASRRPMMSEVPPAGKPLMKRTSLDGKLCAWAGAREQSRENADERQSLHCLLPKPR